MFWIPYFREVFSQQPCAHPARSSPNEHLCPPPPTVSTTSARAPLLAPVCPYRKMHIQMLCTTGGTIVRSQPGTQSELEVSNLGVEGIQPSLTTCYISTCPVPQVQHRLCTYQEFSSPMQALNLKSGHVCGQCPTQVTINHQFCNSLPLPHRLPRPQPLCSCLQRRLRRCYVTVKCLQLLLQHT